MCYSRSEAVYLLEDESGTSHFEQAHAPIALGVAVPASSKSQATVVPNQGIQ